MMNNNIFIELFEEQKILTEKLNQYRNEYYNNSNSMITDSEYDSLYDKLAFIEKQTKIVMGNSPTQSVGYEVKSKLEKVTHNHPMLSLAKTKSINELIEFVSKGKNKDTLVIEMLKLDGLTVSVRYVDGKLVSAETRGNGQIGEDILHNAKVITNLPLEIDYKDELIVDGEVIITYNDFNKINENLSEEQRYRNPRNLASGSIRQLDSSITKDRKLKFVAWKVVKGFGNKGEFQFKLNMISQIGFTIVPYSILDLNSNLINNFMDLKLAIKGDMSNLQGMASSHNYPIDGLVFGFTNIEYGESLGLTSHHVNSQIAYKFYDEVVETTIKDIEFTMGKTGVLTPVAIFEPVEIDGTIVERASVHNMSILNKLGLEVGDTVEVCKRNQIIPQIERNLSNRNRISHLVKYPSICPICGGQTKIVKDNDTEVLKCMNDDCKGKLLGKLVHYCSKNAMNIDGLSEKTLDKLIDLDCIGSILDIYTLEIHEYKIKKLDGFGEKSFNKLIESINNSKKTTLDRFIYSLSIDLIGRTASKTLAKYLLEQYETYHKGNEEFEFEESIIDMLSNTSFDWTILNDFGEKMSESINNYFLNSSNRFMVSFLMYNYIEIENNNNSNEKTSSVDLSGMTFVITGSLTHYSNRDELKELLESKGAKVSGSVSKNTTYLINNDIDSNSGKNKKAKELGVKIINEDMLKKLI